MDYLRLLLWVGAVALLVSIIIAVYLTWVTPTSRNLALATGTLVAAILLFAIQLVFEFRTQQDSDWIVIEYTIDNSKPEIRQWHKDWKMIVPRLAGEQAASEWLAKSNPEIFAKVPGQIVSDLALFSLVRHIGQNMQDWQLSTRRYFGFASTGTTFQRLSKPADCRGFDDGGSRPSEEIRKCVR